MFAEPKTLVEYPMNNLAGESMYMFELFENYQRL